MSLFNSSSFLAAAGAATQLVGTGIPLGRSRAHPWGSPMLGGDGRQGAGAQGTAELGHHGDPQAPGAAGKN